MNKRLLYFIIAVLIGAHVLLGAGAISALSPTYDEPVHLAAGYSYLRTGDYRLNAFDHPPLAEMWAALPLLALRPSLPLGHPYWEDIRRFQYPFSDLFLYQNRVDPEKMLNAGRGMILVLSVLLGLLIFFWAKELGGERAGIAGLFLWSFSPAFLAHGTLVTTDMALTLFYFATMYAAWKWWKNNGAEAPGSFVVTAALGVSLGLVMASKYSAIAVVPVLGAVAADSRLNGKLSSGKLLRQALLALALAGAVLAVVYQFNPLSVYYWQGLKKVITGVTSGRSSFLLGEYSTQGWKYYFPAVFLLKTPLPFLALLAACMLLKSSWKKEYLLFLVLPAAFYFGLSCFSKVQIGHRHILPVYPFLAVWVAAMAPRARRRFVQALCVVPLLWYGAGTIKAHPWHLSYFNELAGSPDKGYLYLTDSNVDWGQGLKALGAYLAQQKAGGIYLNYFGTGDPSYYKIRYA
ncbi:MAG: ArnT family glycosyltransferase, partial [Endomicrobiales bacterium]